MKKTLFLFNSIFLKRGEECRRENRKGKSDLFSFQLMQTCSSLCVSCGGQETGRPINYVKQDNPLRGPKRTWKLVERTSQ